MANTSIGLVLRHDAVEVVQLARGLGGQSTLWFGDLQIAANLSREKFIHLGVSGDR